jgi:hypothetical protein
MMLKLPQILLSFMATVLAVLLIGPAPSQAQAEPGADPASALSAALSAACRADQAQFEKYLTVDSAAALRALPADQRAAFLKRFSLSEEAGKALVTSGPQNRPVVRCQAPGGTAEFRFGEERVHDNLAFIRVDVVDSEQTNFGLIREDGVWRLLSLGLVMLDVPQLSKEWAEADLASHEDAVVTTLSALAGAVESYRRAYGKLPDSLAQLGPAPKGEISPEQADMIDEHLAAGNGGGYHFRYRIASSPNADTPEGDSFELSATPDDYEKIGKRSFFLDAAGKIHGADKHGEIASVSDPVVAPAAQPSDAGSGAAVQ